jgi:hypothetical protein
MRPHLNLLKYLFLEGSCDFFLIKTLQFLIGCSDCLAEGQTKPVRYFASLYMGEPMLFTVCHSGTSCLWIFGRPWSLGVTDVCEVSFFDQSCAMSDFFIKGRRMSSYSRSQIYGKLPVDRTT